jgi:hypothetical protein
MDNLYQASALIDSAAMTGSKFRDIPEVSLSLREEQCLIWAARGKTYEEIGEITSLTRLEQQVGLRARKALILLRAVRHSFKM